MNEELAAIFSEGADLSPAEASGWRMRLDAFLYWWKKLEGPPYNYASYGQSWAWMKANGGHCASTMSSTSRDKLGGTDYGGTVSMSWNHLVSWQPYNPKGSYPRGTVLLNDDYYGDDNDLSHVGMIHDRDQRFIHCYGPQGLNGVKVDPSPRYMSDAWLERWPGWADYEWVGYFADLGADFDPSYFDTDPALGDWWVHPHLLAAFMAVRAERKFGIPGVLPVMTAMIEVADAWDPGPVPFYECYGYSEAADHDSLGFYQQRPSQGWGTPEQLMDPNYATDAFCQAVLDMYPKKRFGTGAAALGEVCANVQRPREDLRHKYALQYQRAKEFIRKGKALIPYAYLPANARAVNPETDDVFPVGAEELALGG